MRDDGKRNVLGVGIDVVDYEAAAARVLDAARARGGLAVSAMAVHGVMSGALDAAHRYRLTRLDLLVPDGQPVRWALNSLYGAALVERVYGPELMLRLCERASREGVAIFLYGSRPEVLAHLTARLQARFPALRIAGAEPSRFRRLTAAERAAVVDRIRGSGAGITFVGLGCPRQEVWAYEYRELLGMPIVAVGAAFDFHAGNLPQAPAALQRRGLEWLFRLAHEPRRLWRRYLLLNPAYLALLALQATRLRVIRPDSAVPPQEVSYG
jgi:exopolysaccharide biosynthesis WecB/TagA/CpsF family protein